MSPRITGTNESNGEIATKMETMEGLVFPSKVEPLWDANRLDPMEECRQYTYTHQRPCFRIVSIPNPTHHILSKMVEASSASATTMDDSKGSSQESETVVEKNLPHMGEYSVSQ